MATLSRRTMLRAGLAAAGASVLSACSGDQPTSDFVAADGDEVRAAEGRRNPAPSVR